MNSVAELHPERSTGYAYETDLAAAIAAGSKRYEQATQQGCQDLWAAEHPEPTKEEAAQRLKALSGRVKKIPDEQEPSGAWITRGDRFKTEMPRGVRWNGQYTVMGLNRADFQNSLKRIAIYANKTTNQVVLDVSDKSLTVSAQDLDFYNEATEQMPCTFDGAPPPAHRVHCPVFSGNVHRTRLRRGKNGVLYSLAGLYPDPRGRRKQRPRNACAGDAGDVE